MTLVINLNDPNLWIPVWEFDVVAETLGSGGEGDSYIRIPKQNCPTILDSSVLAIYANNPLAKPGWFSAGFLSQNIRLPLTVGGQPTSYGASRRIVLGKTQIVSFLDVGVADFSISFLCHRWHRQVQLVAWEYQGSISTQELAAIASLSQQVSSVEQKIDSLL
ncbi:hypothetical protein [Microcoleus sp. CAWBG58]|uniref:hypothetical protein n=1 Tax=Microcoleus sp. CAWBG58 TaxID=2841651 RepID=UPI0025D851B2|nr:hypothetical protein [Microcoleus sp. CAWBG58]